MIGLAANAQKHKGDTNLGFRFDQRWQSSLGVGWYSYPYADKTESIFAINYSPQFDLTLRYSDLSLSLNSQLAGGYHVKMPADTLKYAFADLPLFLQANIGHLASKDFYSYAGLFFGAGYDFAYLRNEFQKRFIATAGIRTWVGHTSVGVRLSRAYANSKANNSINSITLDINVGSYIGKVRSLNKITDFMQPYSK